MDMMTSTKDKMGDMSDEMKQRLTMLRSKRDAGTLNDQEGTELQQLESRMNMGGHGQ